MRNLAIMSLIFVAPLLSGCISPSDERVNALAIATARCEKQGKQVHVVDVSQHGVANVTRFDTTIDFECVAPGEPGYIQPPPK